MWIRLHTPGLLRYSTLVIAFGVILNHWTYPADYAYIAKPFGRGLSPDRQLQLLSGFEWFEPDRLDGFADEARAILSQNPNMPPAPYRKHRQGCHDANGFGNDFIENQPSFHRLTPAAAKTKEPNTPDFLDSEVADMKDASAKLLCDSNSGQPSKNLHTEH